MQENSFGSTARWLFLNLFLDLIVNAHKHFITITVCVAPTKIFHLFWLCAVQLGCMVLHFRALLNQIQHANRTLAFIARTQNEMEIAPLTFQNALDVTDTRHTNKMPKKTHSRVDSFICISDEINWCKTNRNQIRARRSDRLFSGNWNECARAE